MQPDEAPSSTLSMGVSLSFHPGAALQVIPQDPAQFPWLYAQLASMEELLCHGVKFISGLQKLAGKLSFLPFPHRNGSDAVYEIAAH